MNRVDDAVLEAKLADPALARYRPWLRDLRVFRPHQLSDDLEKFSHERDLTANGAWVRLFDETIAAMRITVNNEELTVSDTLNRLSDRDRCDAGSRRQGHRRGFWRQHPPVVADHQHPGQGQGDRGHLAAISARPAATATGRTWSRTRLSMRWRPR